MRRHATPRRLRRLLDVTAAGGTDLTAPGDMVGGVRAFLASGMDGFFTDYPDLGAEDSGASGG